MESRVEGSLRAGRVAEELAAGGNAFAGILLTMRARDAPRLLQAMLLLRRGERVRGSLAVSTRLRPAFFAR